MCAHWNDRGFNPGIVISKLNSARKQSKGKVSYSGFSLSLMSPILVSAIKFNSGIPGQQHEGILRKALFLKTPNGKISKGLLIKQVTALESNYLKKKVSNYFLLSSISIDGYLPFRDFHFDGSQIRLKFDKKKFGDQGLSPTSSLPILGEPPKSYLPVVVWVESRTQFDAATQALDALDVLRGIWNLRLNERQQVRISLGHRPPVNLVRLGPIHTIHNQDGSRASDQFWYEEDYVKDWGTRRLTKKEAEILRKFSLDCRKRLDRSSLKEIAMNGLRRYTRALDKWNWETCFVELWGTLELLTDTKFQSYAVTTKRAAAMYEDYQVALELVKHLRERRNRAIHSAEVYRDLEILIYQLKGYVEDLLRLYIQNPFKFSTPEEVGVFLDLPHGREQIYRRMKLLQNALHFRNQA